MNIYKLIPFILLFSFSWINSIAQSNLPPVKIEVDFFHDKPMEPYLQNIRTPITISVPHKSTPSGMDRLADFANSPASDDIKYGGKWVNSNNTKNTRSTSNSNYEQKIDSASVKVDTSSKSNEYESLIVDTATKIEASVQGNSAPPANNSNNVPTVSIKQDTTYLSSEFGNNVAGIVALGFFVLIFGAFIFYDNKKTVPKPPIYYPKDELPTIKHEPSTESSATKGSMDSKYKIRFQKMFEEELTDILMETYKSTVGTNLEPMLVTLILGKVSEFSKRTKNNYMTLMVSLKQANPMFTMTEEEYFSIINSSCENALSNYTQLSKAKDPTSKKPIGITALIKQAKDQKTVITISNLAPFTFKQIGEEKTSDLPQSITLNFAEGIALLSSSICMIAACDSKVLIQSEEVVDGNDVINFAPIEYDFANCASMMYNDQTIFIVDTEFGMYIKFKFNDQWKVDIN